MKIRTDFVTNSSSSSYCVSLSVETAADKKIELDFLPDGEDGSSCFTIPLREDADQLIASIRACASVEELRDLLLNALSLEDLFDEMEDAIEDEFDEEYDDMDNAKFLSRISKLIKNDEDGDFEDYVDTLDEVKKKIAKFKRAINKIESLEGIRCVNIRENFNGWGEFARDGVEDFLKSVLEKGVDPDNATAVREALSDKLPEKALDSITEQIENDNIAQFDADIVTTVILADGKTEKTYRFIGDN
jgi:hypothetical protein